MKSLLIFNNISKYGRKAVNSSFNQCNFATASKYEALIQPDKTIITKTTHPKEKTPIENLVFGRTFTDHMLTIDWDTVNGWHNPVIAPYGDLKISPASTALHYGIEVSFIIFSH